MRLLASAAALAFPCSSSATLAVMSSLLKDKGVPLVCESRDTELSEGDSSPEVGRTGALLVAGVGGARFFPDPSTLPPPSWRRAAIVHHRSSLRMVMFCAQEHKRERRGVCSGRMDALLPRGASCFRGGARAGWQGSGFWLGRIVPTAWRHRSMD